METAARAMAALLTACLLQLAGPAAAVADTPGTQWDLETPEGQVVCRMLLTGETSAHGRRIRGCADDHSHWRAENGRLLVVDNAGFMSIHLWRTGTGHYAGDGRNKHEGKTYFAFRAGLNPAPGVPGQPFGADAQGYAASLSGRWQYSKKGGQEACEVELTPQRSPLGGFVARGGTNIECSKLNLFHLRRWNMIGGQVVLTDAFGHDIARVNIRSGFLLRGGDVVMQR